MEYVLGWVARTPARIERILSIPEQLLALVGCATAHDFVERVASIDVADEAVHAYAERHAVLHVHTSTRSAELSARLQMVPMPDGAGLVCIATVHAIRWRAAPTPSGSRCSRRGSARLCEWRDVRTGDREYVAVPVAAAPPVSTPIRDDLKRRACVLRYNVAYPAAVGAKTQRSVLFPVGMLATAPIERADPDYHSVFVRAPHHLVHVQSSAELCDLDAPDFSRPRASRGRRRPPRCTRTPRGRACGRTSSPTRSASAAARTTSSSSRARGASSRCASASPSRRPTSSTSARHATRSGVEATRVADDPRSEQTEPRGSGWGPWRLHGVECSPRRRRESATVRRR